jgi:hypothetical protein
MVVQQWVRQAFHIMRVTENTFGQCSCSSMREVEQVEVEVEQVEVEQVEEVEVEVAQGLVLGEG